MRARTTPLMVLLAVLGSAAVAFAGSALGDYPHDARAAVDGLASGDLETFLAAPPLMGTFSVYVRAPFVALANALGGGELWAYRAGSLPCVLALALLGVALARRAAARGAGLVAQLGTVGGAIAIAASAQALRYGHPEELLGAALCIAAVMLAAEGRATLAGLALGLALATKQWAVLAVLPALLAGPGIGPRVRVAMLAGMVALAMTAPQLLSNVDRFVAVQESAATTSHLVLPTNVWWTIAERRDVRVFDGVADRTVTVSRLEGALQRITHPLIVVLAVPLAVLAWWRRRWRPLGHDALMLLALLFLLRCVLDPWNNIYYHVPLVVSLLAYEIVGRRRPVLTAFTGLALIATFDVALEQPHPLRVALYLAWTIPLALHLARIAFDVPARGPRREPILRIGRVARA